MSIHGGSFFAGTPVQPKSKRKRICHGITIVDGQIQHQNLCDYVVSTSPNSFNIELRHGAANYIKKICLFLTDYEFDSDKKPVDSEARAIILGDFEDEVLPKEEMDLYKAINIIERMHIDVRSRGCSISSKLPMFAWEPYWANVISRRQMPFNVDADAQNMDMLPIRIGWVCPTISENVSIYDLDVLFSLIEKNTIPISAQFHIDLEIFE